jgi:hypothetical protein
MLLLPALAGTAFCQTLPAPSAGPAEQAVPTPAVHPLATADVIRRVRVPVPVPAPAGRSSIDVVFQPAPQGLIDAPTALKYRRFLVELQAAQSQRCPLPQAAALDGPAAAHPSRAAVCPVADPFAANPSPAQPRMTKTIRLKNVNCRDAYRSLHSMFAAQPRLKLVGHEPQPADRLILVPEPITNCLLAIGTAKQLEELQQEVKTLDSQLQFEIVVKRILPDGRKLVVGSPRVAFVPGRQVQMQFGEVGGSVMKLSLQVSPPVKQVGFVKVYPHPPLTAINDRCFDGLIGLVPPPAPGVAEEWPIRPVGHTVQPAPAVAESPAEVNRLRLQVRTYSVKNLIQNGSDESAKALMAVIRMTVAPASWDSNNSYGTIRYFGRTSSLVVRQSAEGHRRISELLDQLRAIRNAK